MQSYIMTCLFWVLAKRHILKSFGVKKNTQLFQVEWRLIGTITGHARFISLKYIKYSQCLFVFGRASAISVYPLRKCATFSSSSCCSIMTSLVVASIKQRVFLLTLFGWIAQPTEDFAHYYNICILQYIISHHAIAMTFQSHQRFQFICFDTTNQFILYTVYYLFMHK